MSRKLDDDLQKQIRYFKTNYPRMSAAAIYRQLKTDGSIIKGQVSESTFCRFVNQLQNELSQEKSIKYFFLLIDGENLSFFLLDMDYFLHEFDDLDDDDFGEEGFYIF